MAKEHKYRRAKASDYFDYFDGKMSEEERNAFERQMQKELFNVEASEGFATVSRAEAEADLSLLKGKINRRSNRNKRIAWYSAAAAIAAIAIVGSIFINLNNNGDMGRFETIPEMKEAASEKSAPIKSEQIIIEDDQELSNGPNETQDKGPLNTPKSPIATEPKTNAGAGIAETPEAENDNSLVNEGEVRDIEVFELQDEAGAEEDMALANIEEDVSEDENNLNSEKKESFASSQSQVSPKSRARMESQPSGSQVSEVAEEEEVSTQTDNADASMEKSVANQTVTNMGAVSAVSANYTSENDQSSTPKIGMAAYKNYIDSVLVFPTESYDLESAIVKLEFTVTSAGKATGFKVIQSPSTAFSNEAIRIIQNGSDWIPSKRDGIAIEDTVVYSVVFGEEHKR